MSQHKSLQPQKIAFLVANGCSESDLIHVQRELQQFGATVRIIGVKQSLVTSWSGNGWGLNFAADHALNETLAADYDALIIPGGKGSVDKLRQTAHTRRFIRGFFDAGKPVCALGEGVELLEYAELENYQEQAHVLVSELGSDAPQEVAQSIAVFVSEAILPEQALAA